MTSGVARFRVAWPRSRVAGRTLPEPSGGRAGHRPVRQPRDPADGAARFRAAATRPAPVRPCGPAPSITTRADPPPVSPPVLSDGSWRQACMPTGSHAARSAGCMPGPVRCITTRDDSAGFEPAGTRLGLRTGQIAPPVISGGGPQGCGPRPRDGLPVPRRGASPPGRRRAATAPPAAGRPPPGCRVPGPSLDRDQTRTGPSFPPASRRSSCPGTRSRSGSSAWGRTDRRSRPRPGSAPTGS